MKKCIKCKKELSESSFYPRKGKYSNSHCKKCQSSLATERSRTLKGLPSRIHSRQKASSKIRGHKSPVYTVAELCEWMLSQPIYYELHAEWVESGYDKKKTPSIDRLDDYKGYSFDNIRIMTWEGNLKKGHDDRKNGINNKQSIAVLQYSLDGTFIKEFHSVREAERHTSVNAGNISSCTRGNRKLAGGFIWKSNN